MRGFNPFRRPCPYCGRVISETGGAHARMHYREGLLSRYLDDFGTYCYTETDKGREVRERRETCDDRT